MTAHICEGFFLIQLCAEHYSVLLLREYPLLPVSLAVAGKFIYSLALEPGSLGLQYMLLILEHPASQTKQLLDSLTLHW